MRQTARDTMDCTTFPRINALDAVNAVLLNGTACNDTCGIMCPAGYQPNGGVCDGICGDGLIVDGEECDRGGLCVGGSNPGALCLVSGPPVCLGGGTCQPLVGFGCDGGCQCNSSTCGDGHLCGNERCDVGMHCDSGSNFGADCTDVSSICTAGGGACVNGDKLETCVGGANNGKNCAGNSTLCTPGGGNCTESDGYCDVSCQVRQPQP